MFSFSSDSNASSDKKQRLMKGALALVGALFVLWLIIWLLPSDAPPPVSSDAAGTVAAQSSPSDAGFRLLTPGRIVVVLLLAGGIGFALYLRRQSPTASSGPAPMHVIGHLSIAQDQRLTLVRCQDDVLLLGVSPNDITLLQTYSESAFASASAPPVADRAAPKGPPDTALSGFADVLRQYTNHGRHA